MKKILSSNGFRLIVLFAVVISLAFSCSENFNNADVSSNNETEAEESSIKQTVKDEKLTVVCLGDSVTAGVFELKPCDSVFMGYVYDLEAAYPSLLCNRLKDRGYDVTVYNAGISGDTVYNGYRRLQNDVLKHNPDIVTVCFGLNDIGYEDADYFTMGLGNIFDAIWEYNPDIKIVYMTPNMMADRIHEDTKNSDLNYRMAQSNVYVTESGLLDIYMEAAKSFCAEKGVPVCDAYSHWKDLYNKGEDISELLASHVVHPNREMHVVFADMLIDTLVSNSYIK